MGEALLPVKDLVRGSGGIQGLHLRFAGRGRDTQDYSQQLLLLEREAHESVCADAHTDLAIPFRPHHDNGHRLARVPFSVTDGLDRLRAVHDRHPGLQEHDIEGLSRQLVQYLPTVFGSDYGVASSPEDSRGPTRIFWAAFPDQYPQFSGVLPRRMPRGKWRRLRSWFRAFENREEDIQELGPLNRFRQIARYSELAAPGRVSLLSRGGEQDDPRLCHAGVGLDF